MSKEIPEAVSRCDLGLKIELHEKHQKHRIASPVQKPTAESMKMNMTSMPQHLSHSIHWERSQTNNKDRGGRSFNSKPDPALKDHCTWELFDVEVGSLCAEGLKKLLRNTKGSGTLEVNTLLSWLPF